MYLFHLNIIKIKISVEISWNCFSHFHEVLRISENGSVFACLTILGPLL